MSLCLMFRGFLVWLLIMALESAHGAARMFLLAPQVGEDVANRIGWIAGMAIVLIVSYFTMGWTGLRLRGELMALGLMWALLTFFFELALGLLRGFDTARLIAEADPHQGGLLLASAFVMFIAPQLAARLRQRRGG